MPTGRKTGSKNDLGTATADHEISEVVCILKCIHSQQVAKFLKMPWGPVFCGNAAVLDENVSIVMSQPHFSGRASDSYRLQYAGTQVSFQRLLGQYFGRGESECADSCVATGS